MQKPQTGQQVGALLCAALGLDPDRVAELTINARPCKLAEVHVRMYLDEPTSMKMHAVMREFELVPKNDNDDSASAP